MVNIQRPSYGGGEIYFDGKLIRRDGEFLPKPLRSLNRSNFVRRGESARTEQTDSSNLLERCRSCARIRPRSWDRYRAGSAASFRFRRCPSAPNSKSRTQERPPLVHRQRSAFALIPDWNSN